LLDAGGNPSLPAWCPQVRRLRTLVCRAAPYFQTNKGVMRMSVPVPPDGAFECFYCKSDVRRETVLVVRQISTNFAMFPGLNGKPETFSLDKENEDDPWKGLNICLNCALTCDVPGLDKEKLRSLLAGLAARNSTNN
jgi:hypothetical protein